MNKGRLLCLFVIALALRLLAAASSPFYVDESYTWFMSRGDFRAIMTGLRALKDHPPLWFFMMHPLALCTRNEFLLRLPSCLCGAAAVPIFYLIGQRFGKYVGLWCAVLVAVSYPNWLSDAQARDYGPFTLLGALELYMVLRLREEGRPPGGWPSLCAVAVALPMLHYLGILLDMGLLASCLMSLPQNSKAQPPQRRRAWRAAACLAAGLAVSSLWVVYAALNAEPAPHARVPAWLGALEALRLPEYLSNLSPSLHGVQAAPLAAIAGIAVGALALWGVVTMASEDVVGAWTVGLYILVPLSGVLAGALLGLQVFQNRYLVPVSGAIYLLVALGATRLKLQMVLGLMLFGGLACALTYPTNRALWNQDWVSAARFITDRQGGPQDVIVAYVPYSLVGLDFYYGGGGVDIDFHQQGRMQFLFGDRYQGPRQMPLVDAAQLQQEAFARALAGRRIFLVLNQGTEEMKGRILDWFNRARFGMRSESHAHSVNKGWSDIDVYELWPRGPTKDAGHD